MIIYNYDEFGDAAGTALGLGLPRLIDFGRAVGYA
jgi:hypothetical protein